MPKNLSNFFINCLTNVVDERGDSSQNKYETYSIAQTEDGKLEKKTEVVIVNYIEKMLGERREKTIESDEYIRQDIEDLKELEERYASMKIPYMFRRVIDDYIACMESKSERYADLSYIKGMGDAISLLKNIGALKSQETLSMNVE